MLFIAHLCNHIPLQVVVGLGAQLCNLLEGWVLVVGMSTIGHKQRCSPRIGDPQVPMTLKHDPVTSSGKSAPGPDPRIRHRTQIGMFRPIRMDHTKCLQVAIKTLQFNPVRSVEEMTRRDTKGLHFRQIPQRTST
jgi:hypothetical protein